MIRYSLTDEGLTAIESYLQSPIIRWWFCSHVLTIPVASLLHLYIKLVFSEWKIGLFEFEDVVKNVYRE
jgi:hypothetical protein